MRILITADPEIPVPPIQYGGTERVIAALARGLRANGHAVGLVAHPSSTAEVDARFSWPIGSSQGWRATWQNAAALRAALRAFSPEVVHSFSRLSFMLRILLGPTAKVMTYERHPTQRTVRIASFLAGRRLLFTGCSEFICRMGRIGGGWWTSVPNGVELAKYPFNDRIAQDAPLVFLSRVERIKGAHIAIEVARRTQKRLVIAGNHATDGEEGRYWKEVIEPSIGKDGVEYAGPVNDAQKSELLGKALAMIVPIEWDEPFGVVFAESLACGTPVISCPRGALPEIVRQGLDGLLATSIDELCQAVQDISQIDRRRCRARAEESFSMPVMVRQYERVYQEAMAA